MSGPGARCCAVELRKNRGNHAAAGENPGAALPIHLGPELSYKESAVSPCAQCGKPMRRVHRSAFERLRYAAVYECTGCHGREYVPRPFHFHFGPYVRCPKCGTLDVIRRRKPDNLDRMYWRLLTIIARLSFGRLHHCLYCRIQFYDRRQLYPDLRG